MNGFDAPCPPNPGTTTDSQGAVNVFAVGTHTITGVLPRWLSDPPYNGRIRYVVASMHAFGVGSSLEGQQIPRVEVYVDWTEP